MSENKPSDPRFGSGPTLIPQEFVKELYESGPHILGTSHRKPAVKNIVKSIQEKCKQLFGLSDDYLVALGNGGATHLFDMVNLGMVRNKATHFVCGEFSQKWFKASKNIPYFKAECEEVPFGEGLQAHNVEDSDMICLTLNETSTGVSNKTIPHCPNALVAVDATSGGGQIFVDMKNIDVFFFSPQKVFASEGGLWVCILSPKAIERIKEVREMDRYFPLTMDWKLVLDNAPKNQTYNTPSISSLFFLERQLCRLAKLGKEAIIKDALEKAKLIKEWVESKDYLSFFVKDEEYRSLSVSTIDVSEKVPVNDILKKLSDEGIVYGIEAYRKLNRNQVRVATFPSIKIEDLKKLTQLLSQEFER